MTEYNGFTLGDIVQRKGSDDKYLIVGLPILYGVVNWQAIPLRDTGNGYTLMYFTEWDMTIVEHLDPDQREKMIKKITEGRN